MDSPYRVCFVDRGARDPTFHEHMGHRPLALNQAGSHITVFPGWKVERIEDCPRSIVIKDTDFSSGVVLQNGFWYVGKEKVKEGTLTWLRFTRGTIGS